MKRALKAATEKKKKRAMEVAQENEDGTSEADAEDKPLELSATAKCRLCKGRFPVVEGWASILHSHLNPISTGRGSNHPTPP